MHSWALCDFAIGEEIDMSNQKILSDSRIKYAGSSYAGGNNKTLSAKRGTPVVVIICVISLVLISGGVLLGVWFGGIERQNQSEPVTVSSLIEGRVEFSGGVYYRGTDRVNPANATPVLEGVDEEMNIIRWWIVEIDSHDVLHEGEEGGPEYAFALLRELGMFGEYKLYFRLEETGSKTTHLLGGNFFIKDI